MARIRSPDIISSPNMHAIKSCPRKSKLATFIFLGHHNKALFKSMLLNVKGANHSIKETFITSKSIFP